ncbi:uncharacterized protein LOC113362067 [Papaver somniferum]|uniref:uncharacterized protein LOC113362067 n=1 Tax=Papaver somniferum TaxID=3469 RepID=UPI000E6F776F|nr:uncharacterized protein LOC113362067 [Papaver somniferum]
MTNDQKKSNDGKHDQLPDVEHDQFPIRNIKVKVLLSEQEFEFRNMARTEMGLDKLMDMLKPNLRLKFNDIIDIMWFVDPCLPHSLIREDEFWYFLDHAENDENGWSVLHMQVIVRMNSDDESELSYDSVPPHEYLNPIKHKGVTQKENSIHEKCTF